LLFTAISLFFSSLRVGAAACYLMCSAARWQLVLLLLLLVDVAATPPRAPLSIPPCVVGAGRRCTRLHALSLRRWQRCLCLCLSALFLCQPFEEGHRVVTDSEEESPPAAGGAREAPQGVTPEFIGCVGQRTTLTSQQRCCCRNAMQKTRLTNYRQP
jgi:hypothetical protein